MIGGQLFEFWSLAITRLIGLLGCVYALEVLRRLWVAQPTRGLRAIPRPVLMFTGGWLTILFSIFAWLLLSGSPAITSGLLRAVYGMSLIWAFVGMAWIVSLGQKAWNRQLWMNEQLVVKEMIEGYVKARREERGVDE